jgi:hypothetical protein
MRNPSRFHLALLLANFAVLAMLGCTARRHVETIPATETCTCVLGHPEWDYPLDYQTQDVPEDCRVHGEDVD